VTPLYANANPDASWSLIYELMTNSAFVSDLFALIFWWVSKLRDVSHKTGEAEKNSLRHPRAIRRMPGRAPDPVTESMPRPD
jgi:hypothetical protein